MSRIKQTLGLQQLDVMSLIGKLVRCLIRHASIEVSSNAILLIHIFIQAAKCGNFFWLFIKEFISLWEAFLMLLLKTDMPSPKRALA